MSSEPRPELPNPIASAIARVRGQVNRHVVLDTAMCALFGGIACAAPVAFVLYAAHQSLVWAAIAFVLGAIIGTTRELRRRLDTLDAALLLDRLLKSHDRFSTAYQFSRLEEPAPLERLQIKEALEYLEAKGAAPKVP